MYYWHLLRQKIIVTDKVRPTIALPNKYLSFVLYRMVDFTSKIYNQGSTLSLSSNQIFKNLLQYVPILLLFLLALSGSSALANSDRNLDAITIRLQNGQNLASALKKTGIKASEAESIVQELSNVYDVNQIRPNQDIKLVFEILDTLGEDIEFAGLELKVSNSQKVQVSKLANGLFFAHVFDSKNQPKLVYISAKVGATLFSAAMNAGITHEMFNELIKAYSFDVDFERDVAPGDEFEILFEAVYDEAGNLVSSGDILYTALNTKNRKITLIKYTTSDNSSDYYHYNGDSSQAYLLKTPVNGARISSLYGKRNHPILGFSKMHKGVDFAAPTGTPIYAAGNGIIADIRRNGGYGNYIKIYHDNTFSTVYAHMSAYAPRLKRGSKVTQGQIIGYVGSTGRSTGPHLHYEIIQAGRHVDPLTIKTGNGKKLTVAELDLFKKYRDSLTGTVERMAKKSHEVRG